jgi:GNAT superfamily N-acetyltransferase
LHGLLLALATLPPLMHDRGMGVLAGPQRLLGDMIIRAVRPGEEDAVLDLLAEVAAWLRRRGIAQWPERFPVDSVTRQIAAGEALVVEDGEHLIATVAVADSDEDLWGSDSEPAYYVSRLAVRRASGGRGFGYRILDWVDARAAARGRGYVRLATASNNPALRQYYEQAGFRHVGDPPHARWPTSLYERRTSSRP